MTNVLSSSLTLLTFANICIDLGYWLSHFKTFTTIIIPKPNKISYDSPKSFHPIVLLNTTEKLFKKMIGERLQFLMISNKFIHPCQLVLWNTWTLTFFFFLLSIFLDFIFLFFWIYFSFSFLTMKGHMTLQSHDMSHDVTS